MTDRGGYQGYRGGGGNNHRGQYGQNNQHYGTEVCWDSLLRLPDLLQELTGKGMEEEIEGAMAEVTEEDMVEGIEEVTVTNIGVVVIK